ncbi:hypothetical protein H632_c404p0 [Helicosporidium sp. ATCC 50920]|nr:hypothetical protein H632_c404p0 [Helicosporidium sp. ATCC 50920]|eukprot:KDD75992.1 hypothetical protein H632_c404p0 [Helicosporidium sp. ATCC 50920]
MVKSVSVTHVFEDCSLEEVFGALYVDPSFARAFHLDVNGDASPTIPDWDLDRRTVTFAAPVDAPAIVRRFLGTNSVRVHEKQRLELEIDGEQLDSGGVDVGAVPPGPDPHARSSDPSLRAIEAVIVHSTPVPQLPGADRFVSSVRASLRRRPEGGCSVDSTVTCSASGPYGLAGALESFMLETAARIMRLFVEASIARVDALAGRRTTTSSPKTEAPSSEGISASPSAVRSALRAKREGVAVLAARVLRPLLEAQARVERQLLLENAALLAHAETLEVDRGGMPGAGVKVPPGPAAQVLARELRESPRAGSPAPEEFYDADEKGPSLGSLPLPPLPDASPVETATLLYLQYLCRTGDALSLQLAELRQELADVRRERARAAPFAGRGVARAVFGLAAVAAGGFALGCVVWRRPAAARA